MLPLSDYFFLITTNDAMSSHLTSREHSVTKLQQRCRENTWHNIVVKIIWSCRRCEAFYMCIFIS